MNPITTVSNLAENPTKYLDWRAWGRGLWSSVAVAGATAFTTMVSTNGVEVMVSNIPVISDATRGMGMGWKTAIAQLVIHALSAAAKYISDTKGLPPEITEMKTLPTNP